MGRYFDDLASPEYLAHYGIPRQKRGVRRFQYEDGSLTPAGRERYGVGQNGEMSRLGKRRYAKDIVKALNKTDKAISKDYRFNNDKDINNTKAGIKEINDLLDLADASNIVISNSSVYRNSRHIGERIVGASLAGAVGGIGIIGGMAIGGPTMAVVGGGLGAIAGGAAGSKLIGDRLVKGHEYRVGTKPRSNFAKKFKAPDVSAFDNDREYVYEVHPVVDKMTGRLTTLNGTAAATPKEQQRIDRF